jgi:hypothetical protein
MNKNLFTGFMIASMFFLFVIFFQQCSSNRKLNRQEEQCDSLRKTVFIIQNKVNSLPDKKDIKIEGLQTEKRMIQATDRKILDVNRQSEIEKEIEKLEKK